MNMDKRRACLKCFVSGLDLLAWGNRQRRVVFFAWLGSSDGRGHNYGRGHDLVLSFSGS